MIVVSANVSGLKGAIERGFFDLPHIRTADVLCLQETRCDSAEAIGESLGYHAVALDRGRDEQTGNALHGGVAIYSTLSLANPIRGGHDCLKPRGQFVGCTVAGTRIASMYVTLDASGEQFEAMDSLLHDILSSEGPALICGDMNTFRDERDSWSFADSMRKGGYGCNRVAMEWFKNVFASGWIDALEAQNPMRPLYTWWSKNDLYDCKKGTRVDYILASPQASKQAVSESGRVHAETRFGGHAQISIALEGGIS